MCYTVYSIIYKVLRGIKRMQTTQNTFRINIIVTSYYKNGKPNVYGYDWIRNHPHQCNICSHYNELSVHMAVKGDEHMIGVPTTKTNPTDGEQLCDRCYDRQMEYLQHPSTIAYYERQGK